MRGAQAPGCDSRSWEDGLDDLQYGRRNKRCDWAPNARLELPPYWVWPPKILSVLKWLPEYLFPWNAFHMAMALLYWFYIVPDVTTMKTLGWSWALRLYAVNAAAIFLMYGS